MTMREERLPQRLKPPASKVNFIASSLRTNNKSTTPSLKYWRNIGDVDALVNLAGGTIHKKRIQDLALDEWQEILDANLKSTFLCCRAVTGVMKNRKAGNIVNTSSNFGFTGSPLHTAYSAAKYGVVGFSKSLALELAPFGIRVNCIAPGLTATERVLSHHSRDAFEAMSRTLPIGHAGEPADVADGIVFLLSNDSDYMTGQTLHVNGGMVLP